MIIDSIETLMGDSTNGNAALVRRIIQLENERDELQRDIETLCIQQSGQAGSADLLARLQARRVTGLEQELESCKQKLANCSRENNNLQDELSQVYQIKAKFADLYEEEVEKNKEVQKEVKFFQGKLANSLADRDRALIEVDKAHSREDFLKNELKELKNRAKLMEIENGEQYRYCLTLQQTMDELKSSDEIYRKLIGKFWRIRACSRPSIDVEVELNDSLPWKDQALCLLEESDSEWTFGNNEAKYIIAYNRLQESKLAHLKERLVVEVVQLRSWHGNTKEIINAYLRDARNCLDTSCKMLSEALESARLTAVGQVDLDEPRDDDARCKEDVRDVNLDKNDDAVLEENIETLNESVGSVNQMFNADNIEEICFADKGVVENHPTVAVQDDKGAYIQAMQEKVAALLLLSQEEERYILKEKMVKGLEEQISHLNQKLSQVTSEKVLALMEVAQLKQDVQRLQDEQRQLLQLLQQHRSTSASGRLLPASWTESSAGPHSQGSQIADSHQRKPNASLEATLTRNWLTSSYTAGLKILGTNNGSKMSGNKKDEALENARLRIENAALQEHVSNLQHLTRSIYRLAVTLAQVFDSLSDEQTEAALKEALKVVEGAASEAQHLKVALSCCLPISWSGEISSEPRSLSAEQNYLVDSEVTNSVSDPPLVGMAMVELLLGTCKIQKVTLESRLRVIPSMADDVALISS